VPVWQTEAGFWVAGCTKKEWEVESEEDSLARLAGFDVTAGVNKVCCAVSRLIRSTEAAK